MKTNRKTLRNKNQFCARVNGLEQEIIKHCIDLQAINTIWTEEWFAELTNPNLSPIKLDEEHIEKLNVAYDTAHTALRDKIEGKIKVIRSLTYNQFASARDEKIMDSWKQHTQRSERLGL